MTFSEIYEEHFEQEDWDSDWMDEYLDKVPDEQGLREVLDEIDCYDDIELYYQLFDRYADIMTEDERKSMIRQYKKLFILPLPPSVEDEFL